MAIFTGTNGNDTLIGTAADDLFAPLLGLDSIDGGGGLDTLTLDWAGSVLNGGVSTILAGPAGSFRGNLAIGAGTAATLSFTGIESIIATFSGGSDTVVLDTAPLASGAAINLNGGAGYDTLRADFSAFASTSFVQGVNFLISSSHGTFAGFEQFDLTLGSGTNAVALQGGNDTIRSTGGIDQIDGGAGHDLWLADFSSWSSNISFGWDGDRNLAAVSNGTNVSRVEGGAIIGGSGDDAFFLNGLNPFAVNGGTGRDMLIWDESGHLAAGYSAIFRDGGSGSFSGSIQYSDFTAIEQVNVALSDADNYAYVDTAPLAAGATMNLDGGGGSDTLEIEFSGYADTTFALDESGTARTSHGTYGNFEHFGMALGGGTNVVTTGGGDDTVYSLGGADQIDAGAGFDFWGGDYSEKTANLTFTWNGTTGSGSLSGGTVLSGFETGYVLTGTGNDVFILSGLMPLDVSGGAGSDTLIRDDTGIVGANPDSFILSAGTWFAGWVGNGQFDGIEQVVASFSDDDNTVFVDAAPLTSGASLNLGGGLGADTLLIDFSALAGTVFTVGAGNVVSGNRGTYTGFERYSIALGGGANTVTTGAGDDTVEAGLGGTSTIATGDGDDAIWGGTGTETVLGGAGVDHFHVSGSAAGFAITRDGLGSYVLTDTNLADGNQGTDRLTGVEWIDFSDGAVALPFYSPGLTLTGTGGADVLTGTAYADTLLGLAGNDRLVGGDGDDLLNGGAGSDTIAGGAGVDTLSYEDAGAAVKLSLATLGKGQATGGSGNDWLVDALEGLKGSAFNDALTGNALDNRIEGLAGNDTIDGGAGADTLAGGLGNDTFVVDTAGDVVNENADEGTDLVTAQVGWTLGANLENLTLLGTTAIDGTGNVLGNLLTGNAAANQLFGMAGSDTITAGGGNDLLIGGAGADILTGGTGNDTFRFDLLETAANKDTIKDFAHGTDKLELVRSAFTAFAGDAAGALNPLELAIGTAATTAAHHLVYTPATGALFYDADGVGGTAQVQIALLSAKLALDAGDIMLL